jgi:hypothetical protein
MLQLPLNIVFFISFYLHCLSSLTFVFLVSPPPSFFDVPLCIRRRIRQNRILLEISVFLLSPPGSSSRNNNEDAAEMGAGGTTEAVVEVVKPVLLLVAAVQNSSSYCQKARCVTVAAMSVCHQQRTYSEWKTRSNAIR